MKDYLDLNTGTRYRYFVVFKWKELHRPFGHERMGWRSFPTRRRAEEFWKTLFRRTSYRAMSYGHGCVLAERGRP